MNKKGSAWAIVGMIILALGLGAGVYFLSRPGGGLFELRQKAAGPTGVASINFQPPQTQLHYVGDQFPLDVMMNTAGKFITGVAFRLTYQDDRLVDLVDRDLTIAGVQIDSFSAQLDPSFVTNV